MLWYVHDKDMKLADARKEDADAEDEVGCTEMSFSCNYWGLHQKVEEDVHHVLATFMATVPPSIKFWIGTVTVPKSIQIFPNQNFIVQW